MQGITLPYWFNRRSHYRVEPRAYQSDRAGWSQVLRVLNQSTFATKTPHRSLLSRWATVFSLLCAGSLLLVACGETANNEEDRRFANDPSQDDQTTEAVRETTVPEATPTVKPLPSPEALLRSRGAPGTVYAILNDAIQSIQLSDSGTKAGTIRPPDGERFVAIDSSPSGDRVAAVTTSTESAARVPIVNLYVFDTAGTEVEVWTEVITQNPAPSTPTSTISGAADMDLMVDWGAQGNRIVVVSPDGQMVNATLGADATTIPTPSGITAIRDVEWSPRGDRIAILGVGQDNVARIGLIDPAAAAPEFLPIAPIDEGGEQEQIRSFSWLPDGSGVVYLSGTGDDIDAVGGQLFSVDLETMSQRLVATAGRGGPSATINDFSVSPDGKAVAYTIVLPDGGDWRFNSLWVRSLRDQRALEMPVGNVIEVNALWWVDRGLLWGQAVSRGDGIQESFIRLSPGGDPTAILAIDVGSRASSTSGGTPGATPELATPVT